MTAIPRFGDARDWFFQKRFGMFVHWGLYAIDGWHEQQQWRAKVPRAQYETLAKRWNPRHFSPDRWLDLMQEAGMEYLCLTTKHHDGFCLFVSRHTDFHVGNTPYGRDIVAEVAEACHRRGVPLCLYYSVVDWHHPHYPNQGCHHELPGPEPGDRPDLEEYLEFLKNQVRELCTNYGALAGFWWDMNVTDHRDPSINAMIRRLQPGAVINNRGFDEGDFGTPERDFEEDTARVFSRPTEACQSVGVESWGYRKDEDYFAVGHLQRCIDRYLSRGANYLLNVGPDADGEITRQAAAILRVIGTWHRHVRESWTDVRPLGDLPDDPNVLLTCRDNLLYLHFREPMQSDDVRLPALTETPRQATLLNDGRALSAKLDLLPSDHESGTRRLCIRGFSADELAATAPVIRLDFDRPVEKVLALP